MTHHFAGLRSFHFLSCKSLAVVFNIQIVESQRIVFGCSRFVCLVRSSMVAVVGSRALKANTATNKFPTPSLSSPHQNTAAITYFSSQFGVISVLASLV